MLHAFEKKTQRTSQTELDLASNRYRKLAQAVATKTLGITQPRLNQLFKGKIGEFSLDALVNMATRAGMRVGLTIRPVAAGMRPATPLGLVAMVSTTPKPPSALPKTA